MTYKKAVVLAAGALMAAGAASPAMADAAAEGQAIGSPGVASGNLVQVPVHVPINLCGNTVNIIAALNPVFGNTCVND
ncbi:Chaplin-D [Streptomyces sp. enrichment culture]|uniref:Chaplin n=1 Tax=Streptomyces toxytricini TaxID=67369 RepID=A0ABW8ET78_STRT5|nr:MULTISPECIES: chaplin [Streptomyces]MBD3579170.1 chaplin [Streptomyces sp. KD18]GGT08722.1 membrane protein [Streptomyces toxytricini]